METWCQRTLHNLNQKAIGIEFCVLKYEDYLSTNLKHSTSVYLHLTKLLYVNIGYLQCKNYKINLMLRRINVLPAQLQDVSV